MSDTRPRLSDRERYHEAQRAAQAMRADARHWRELLNDLIATPLIYGPDASDYLAGVKARLEIVAGWCDHQAERNEEIAETYRHLLGAA